MGLFRRFASKTVAGSQLEDSQRSTDKGTGDSRETKKGQKPKISDELAVERFLGRLNSLLIEPQIMSKFRSPRVQRDT